MTFKLDYKIRYLQIAFNYDLALVMRILPRLPHNPRILIEAGTPFIKREGMRGVSTIRQMWQGHVVADLKTADSVIVLGNAPTETLDLFVEQCNQLDLISMVDLLGAKDPLKIMRPMSKPPDVVVLHKGRDEEGTKSKSIEYRHVNRIRSKFDVSIAAAGGVGLNEARSAIFNGANIVVVNLVRPGDPWHGISTEEDIAGIARQFLTTIE